MKKEELLQLMAKYAVPQEILVPAPAEYDSIPFSRQMLMPMNFIVDAMGLENYRTPSKKGLEFLANSLNIGLMEPLTLSFNTEDNSWKFLDGRRRFGAAYMQGFTHIATEIYYNLGVEIEERLEASLNATKTKIPSADIALFAKKLAQQINNYRLEKGDDSKFITMNELAAIMCRSLDTIYDAFKFNELDDSIIQYVSQHPEEKLYFKAVRLGKKLKQNDHQKLFFEFLLKELHKPLSGNNNSSYKSSNVTIKYSDKKFNDNLNEFVRKLEEDEHGFEMRTETIHKNGTPKIIKEFLSKTNAVQHYLNGFKQLLNVSSELKKEFLLSENYFRKGLKLSPSNTVAIISSEFLESISEPNLKNLILKYINSSSNESLHDQLIAHIMKRRGATNNGNLETIGGKIQYIRIDMIEEDSENIRLKYNPESIDNLAQEIRATFQVKPGLLSPIRNESGEIIKYKVVYGKTRRKAVAKAGINFFKCYVVDDLLPHETALLQSLEDLSESDKYMERARKIHSQYELVKQIRSQQGIEYTKEDFIKEHKSLGSKKVLETALEVLTLPKDIQIFLEQNLLNTRNGIKLGSLSADERFEIFYGLILGSKSRAESNMLIEQKFNDYLAKQKGVYQQALFDLPPVYTKAIEEFYFNITSLSKHFKQSLVYLEKHNDAYLSKKVHIQMARVVKHLQDFSEAL